MDPIPIRPAPKGFPDPQLELTAHLTHSFPMGDLPVKQWGIQHINPSSSEGESSIVSHFGCKERKGLADVSQKGAGTTVRLQTGVVRGECSL